MLKRLLPAVLGCLAGVYAHTASAAVISVDLDPGAAGVQSFLSVAPGATFTVDVVVENPGALPVKFDTVAMDMFFASGGGVAAFAGTPIAGSLADTGGSGLSFDGVDPGFGIVNAGSPLVVDPFLLPPPPAGITSLGGVSYFDPGEYEIGPGSFEVIFSIDLLASASGSSGVETGGIFGGTALTFGGDIVSPLTHAAGIVEVAAVAAVPEPGTLALFGAGLFGIAWIRRRRGV